MYTKLSDTLSIKYPHDTEYPIPTGRSTRMKEVCVVFDVGTTQKGRGSAPLSGSATQGPLLVYKLHADSFKAIFSRVPAAKLSHGFELQSRATDHH